MAEKAEGNLLSMIDQYHEAIIIMMRHGTSVDHIAKNWSYQKKTGSLHQKRKPR